MGRDSASQGRDPTCAQLVLHQAEEENFEERANPHYHLTNGMLVSVATTNRAATDEHVQLAGPVLVFDSGGASSSGIASACPQIATPAASDFTESLHSLISSHPLRPLPSSEQSTNKIREKKRKKNQNSNKKPQNKKVLPVLGKTISGRGGGSFIKSDSRSSDKINRKDCALWS